MRKENRILWPCLKAIVNVQDVFACLPEDVAPSSTNRILLVFRLVFRSEFLMMLMMLYDDVDDCCVFGWQQLGCCPPLHLCSLFGLWIFVDPLMPPLCGSLWIL